MVDVILQLNADWRVADDPPQWVLQKRVRAHQLGKASGWESRKYIRNRIHLLRRIGELCGEVDPTAIEAMNSWPDGHVTWKLLETRYGAGPETGPHRAISLSNDGGSPQDDDALDAAA